MKHLTPIFKRELKGYFDSPIAYIFIAVFLIIANWLFWQNFFLFDQANMRAFFDLLPWFFIFLIPAVTMRLWAEEKRTGTIEVLLTLPVSDLEVVLAKFLAGFVFIAVALALTLSIPISIAMMGHLDWGVVIGSYIGALLLGGAYLALGAFISSLTKNQIIAFILALVGCFIMFIIGNDFVLNTVPRFIAPVFSALGLGRHFANISKGVIDTRDLLYYFSFIALFVWLNAKAIESRNWR